MSAYRTPQTELEQDLEKVRRKLAENERALVGVLEKLKKLVLHEIDEDDDDEEAAPPAAADGQAAPAPELEPAKEKEPDELRTYSEEELADFDTDHLKAEIALLEGGFCMWFARLTARHAKLTGLHRPQSGKLLQNLIWQY